MLGEMGSGVEKIKKDAEAFLRSNLRTVKFRV
jgi:hypothetical protein